MTRVATVVVIVSVVASAAFAAAPGSLDDTFSGDGKQRTDVRRSDIAAAIAIQRDGKIVVVGASDEHRLSRERMVVARYTSDGALDRTFSGDGKLVLGTRSARLTASDVAIQPDGKIVIAGSVGTDFIDSDLAVVRLLTNGRLDPAFSPEGRAGVASIEIEPDYDSVGNGLALQPDGRIVVVGETGLSEDENTDFAAARLTPVGELDTSFDGDGRARFSTEKGDPIVDRVDESATDVAIDRRGRVLVAGYRDFNFAALRLTKDGALDREFSEDGARFVTPRGGGYADALAVQANGRIVLAGRTNVAARTRADYPGTVGLIRLMPGGQLDRSFSGNGRVTSNLSGRAGDGATAVEVQPDGKLVVAGYVAGESLDQTYDQYSMVARYTRDGRLDRAFSPDGWAAPRFRRGWEMAEFRALALQPDRRIVAAGYSAPPNDERADIAIARYRAGR